MARDYRHGYGERRGYQRRSQQDRHDEQDKRAVTAVWGVAFLLSLLFLLGYFIVDHFVSSGVKSTAPVQAATEQSLYQQKGNQPVSSSSKADTLETVVEDVSSVSVIVETPVSVAETGNRNVVEAYSFYEGLGQTEVVVDVEPISTTLDNPYYIQAGSFGSREVALQELARLAKMGQELELSPLRKPNRTYYRLRVGPFTDRLLLNKKRNALRELGVDTLLIKAPKTVLPVVEPVAANATDTAEVD